MPIELKTDSILGIGPVAAATIEANFESIQSHINSGAPLALDYDLIGIGPVSAEIINANFKAIEDAIGGGEVDLRLPIYGISPTAAAELSVNFMLIADYLAGSGTPSRLSGDTWPEQPQALPPNLIPQPAGEFETASGWNTFDGLTIADGVAKWDGTTTATSVMQIPLTQNAVTGNRYGLLIGVSAYTAGNAIPGLQPPSSNPFGSGANSEDHRSRQLLATGDYSIGRVSVAAGSAMDIDYLRAYDITALLEKKWRIVFVYSQSNWVATTVLPADRYEFDLPEARAVYIPSREVSTIGAQLDGEGVGVPMLMCDPVAHLAGAVTGGPATAFARTFCDGLRDDEVLVYVAAGYSGGGRLASDAPWYNEGGVTGGVAWVNLLKQVDGVLAKAPQGSSIAGMLHCQGEADINSNVGDQHAETIRADFEFLRSRYGQFPIVVNDIGREDTGNAGVANMRASHAKLDSNSGDPLALPLCRYVPRPAGSVFTDGLHYDQATQRIRGANAATALLELNYGGPE